MNHYLPLCVNYFPAGNASGKHGASRSGGEKDIRPCDTALPKTARLDASDRRTKAEIDMRVREVKSGGTQEENRGLTRKAPQNSRQDKVCGSQPKHF